MIADNKTLVRNYYEALYSPDFERAVSDYLSADYSEHQYTAGFTKSGLKDHVGRRLGVNPNHQVKIHHEIGQGEFGDRAVYEEVDTVIAVARSAEILARPNRIDGLGALTETVDDPVRPQQGQ